MKRPDGSRQRAEQRGGQAETLCIWLLRLKGYRIVARRYKVPVGEIDIVARRGHTLIAVEVKARDTLRAAAESVLTRQRRRIARAVEYFLVQHPRYRAYAIRFDAVLVVPGRWPRHLRNAWMVD